MKLLTKPTTPQIDMDTTSPYTDSLSTGQMRWNTTDGTLDIGLYNSSVLQVGQELHFYGKAVTAIQNGRACQFAGVQGDHILLKEAVGDEIKMDPHYFVGIATNDIAQGAFGYVTCFGKVNDIVTDPYWGEGAILYLKEATTVGELSVLKPDSSSTKMSIAVVIKPSTGEAANGSILVRPYFSVNLDMNDDVSINWPNPEEVLTYDGFKWVNYPLKTINNQSLIGSGNISISGTVDPALILQYVYPVGSIYMSVNNVSPASFVGGTWAVWGTGRVPIGVDTGATEFNTVEKTGGAKYVTLSASEMPSHTHTQNAHTHTQNAHTHTQNAHTHTQDAHGHSLNVATLSCYGGG